MQFVKHQEPNFAEVNTLQGKEWGRPAVGESEELSRIKSRSMPTQSRFYKYPIIGVLLRFFRWWLVFSGIYAMSSVCPFCGQFGCPVGGGAAGLVGGLFAVLVQQGKAISRFAKNFLLKPSN